MGSKSVSSDDLTSFFLKKHGKPRILGRVYQHVGEGWMRGAIGVSVTEMAKPDGSLHHAMLAYKLGTASRIQLQGCGGSSLKRLDPVPLKFVDVVKAIESWLRNGND